MKNRFSTLDIIAIVPELKNKICTGWRVNQVYDCDSKTYLFKLNKSIVKMKKDDDPVSVDEETANKMTFIIESGVRMHTTDFDWPKSHAPSGFATKLRKSLRNKRIEDIRQVGVDRLVDIKFGSSIAANHLIIELYDRGNLILTDYNYTIIAILRWRKPTVSHNNSAQSQEGANIPIDSEDFKVGQLYPLDRFENVKNSEVLTEEKIFELLENSESILSRNHKKRNKLKQQRDSEYLELNLKDLLNPYVVYGSSLLEDKILDHVKTFDGFPLKKCVIQIPKNNLYQLDKEAIGVYAKSIHSALVDADTVLRNVKETIRSPGYIVQKRQDSEMTTKISQPKKGDTEDKSETKIITTNIDFFPIRSCAERRVQLEGASNELTIQEYESFDKVCDVYYCNLESQKIDSKAILAEKDARKKLENLKIAQEKRLDDLGRAQKDDEEKARLIEMNSDKVENALLIIRSMIANQVSWSDIWTTIKEAQAMKDPIASLITSVKFDRNEFTMKLCDPYEMGPDDSKHKSKNSNLKFRNVEIDISLSAYANARKFFGKRRTSVNKEKKTIEVSKKALKNVERRTKEMLKEVVVKTNITKARKRYWFENFFWFISTDGYLVVAGRDAEQNELLVKRYMKNNDIYVHADLHGASSVIIKNEFSQPIPPKTLNEAGCMAVCYSSAWDSKIATTSWWVYPKQVSKTAPAGEYLTLGAFIIRGKKNYLPLSNLVLGFGFLFRLDEESVERRRDNRIAKELARSQDDYGATKEASADESSDGQSINASDNSDSDSDDPKVERNIVNENDGVSRASEENDDIVEKTLEDVIEEDEDDEELDGNKTTEHRLIDTLTESPISDDILLYAIPMCGPYSALQSFKYKVKVIPGSNKRGKAAKACLGLFLHEKKSTQREKDLMRALKDQDYARNIPNKVKISTTNMKTITKKRPKKSEVRLPIRT